MDETDFSPLFDGVTLAGWHAAPRSYGRAWPEGPLVTDVLNARGIDTLVDPEKHPAVWTVEDGAIVGRQETPGSGYGGYLVSDDSYADFELILEMKPDWPADTGVMIRRQRDSWEGFQVLVDHRESGGIGGFYGNGIGGFHALPFAISAQRDANGQVVGLRGDDPVESLEPVTAEKMDLLSYVADVSEFLAVWRWADWNELRIRCVGPLPTITTWVNDVKIAQLDTAGIQYPNYNPQKVLAALGPRGHIALEVHDNDAQFGDARWGRGAACRWRNIRIATL